MLVGKIFIPRSNKRDALSAEVFMQSLGAQRSLQTLTSLELVGDSNHREILFRCKTSGDFNYIKNNILATWPQATVQQLGEREDRLIAARAKYPYVKVYEARLREPPYYPLRTSSTREGKSTYDDFSRGGDPLPGLLAALEQAPAGQGLIGIQYLVKPLSGDWARRWRGNVNDIHERLRFTPYGIISTLGGALGAFSVLISLLAIPLYLLSYNTVWIFRGIGLFVVGLLLMSLKFILPALPDPLHVYQKFQSNGFRCKIRIFIYSNNPACLERCRLAIERAFSGYNMPSANGFKVISSKDETNDPQNIDYPNTILDKYVTLSTLLPGGWQHPLLCASELSSLWHMPHETSYVPNMEYTTSKRVVQPQSIFKIADGGFLVGEIPSGESNTYRPVYIGMDNIRGNIGLLARTQSGKSNMMAALAQYIMNEDPEASIIIIDPHRSLANLCLSLIPRSRVDQLIYLDMGNPHHTPVLNLLDQSNYDRFYHVMPDKRVSDMVTSMREIWQDSWGPRMEDYLRESLITLIGANRMLLEEFKWREQIRALLNMLHRNKEVWALSAPIDHLVLSDFKYVYNNIVNSKIAPASPHGRNLYEGLMSTLHSLNAYLSDIENALTKNPSGKVYIDEKVFSLVNEIYRTAMDIEKGNSLFDDVYKARLIAESDAPPDQVAQFTILDVAPLLYSPPWKSAVVSLLTDKYFNHHHLWWENNYDRLIKDGQARMLIENISPISNKINSFTAMDSARRIFGVGQSTLSLYDVIKNGKILIVDLAAGVIGNDAAALIGSTLINWVAAAVFERQVGMNPPLDKNMMLERRVYLIVDEFQSIPGAQFQFILSELNKYGVNIIMGTQSLQNFNESKRGKKLPWLDNVHTLFVFQCGAEDARVIQGELNNAGGDDSQTVQAADIVGLEQYHCYIRTRDKMGRPLVLKIRTKRVEPVLDRDEMDRILEMIKKKYYISSAKADDYCYEINERMKRLCNMILQSNARATEVKTAGKGGKK